MYTLIKGGETLPVEKYQKVEYSPTKYVTNL